MNYGELIGTKGVFKVIDRNLTQLPGEIVDPSLALFGTVRIRLEDGRVVPALYPPVPSA